MPQIDSDRSMAVTPAAQKSSFDLLVIKTTPHPRTTHHRNQADQAQPGFTRQQKMSRYWQADAQRQSEAGQCDRRATWPKDRQRPAPLLPRAPKKSPHSNAMAG